MSRRRSPARRRRAERLKATADQVEGRTHTDLMELRTRPDGDDAPAVAIFDTSVPVYMQTVRETRICPELIPSPGTPAHPDSQLLSIGG